MRLWLLGLPVVIIVNAALLMGWSGAPDHPDDQQTISIHFSRFEPELLTVRAGTPVSFELVNHDPIEHEWIVGKDEVHEVHRLGTEPYHNEVPTEVTLRPFETKTTVVTFDEPGEYAFICHLPGHEAYGMRGIVRVVE